MKKNSKILTLSLLALGSVGTLSLLGFSSASNTKTNSTQTVQSASVDVKDTTTTNNEVNDKQEINSNDEMSGETKDDNISLPTNAISEAQASQIAVQANPGTNVTGISTDDENGTIVYTIVLDNKTEVKVGVVKGIIIKTEKGGEGDNYNKSHKEGTGEIEDGGSDTGGNNE